jgi:hypothetical protein
MASKLPGWSFLLVGVALIAYSKFIEAKSGANLAIFFWIGVGFLAFGAYREFIPRLRKKPIVPRSTVGPPPQRTEPVHDHRHPAGHHVAGQSPHATHAHVAPTTHPSHPHTPATKPCPRCYQAIPYANRFCGHCGYRFY